MWVFGSSSSAVILKVRLEETALPSISMRMCSSVTPDQAASSSNSALNLWKSPWNGSSSIHICARACQALEAQLAGMNFSTKSASIFSKVWSLSLTLGFAHAIGHPLENDFPHPLSILFRKARILFFSSYKEGFKAKQAFICSSHRLVSSSLPEKFSRSLAFSLGIVVSVGSVGGLMGLGWLCK